MKEGLDYFYLVCNPGEKLNLIEAEFGITGFAVIVKLLQKIYGEKGYYCNWNDDVALLFADRVCRLQGVSVVSEIVKCAVRRKFFDEEMLKRYGILTSASIQEYYFEAAKRRTSVEVHEEYLLLSDAKIPKNVNKTPKNASRNAQRRVEESRGEETFSLENVSMEPISGSVSFPAITLLLNDGTEYLVPQKDIVLYIQTYPKVDVVQELREMSLWCINNPQKRKTKNGIKRFISNWLGNEQDKGSSPSKKVLQKQSKFVNYPQSEWDFAEIERLEREQREKW